MQATMRLRKDERGGVGAMALLAVLTVAAGLGVVMLFSNDYVDIGAKIYDLDTSANPWTAKVDAVVTNKQGGEMHIEFLEMTVWADAGRTIPLSTARIVDVEIPSGATIMRTIDVEITNPDAYGGKVWVDLEVSWQHGGVRYHEQTVGREVSVGGALAGLL